MAKILVIEDDEDIQNVLVYILQEDGHEVISSLNVLTLAEVEAMSPDIILLDQWLRKNEKGSAWCKKLKANLPTVSIPVLMLSAFTPIEQVVLEACADGYIKKPFDINELCLQINKTLEELS
jgi:DNA-binding response OmpR family regulator